MVIRLGRDVIGRRKMGRSGSRRPQKLRARGKRITFVRPKRKRTIKEFVKEHKRTIATAIFRSGLAALKPNPENVISAALAWAKVMEEYQKWKGKKRRHN